jgi:hypothetical protein
MNERPRELDDAAFLEHRLRLSFRCFEDSFGEPGA